MVCFVSDFLATKIFKYESNLSFNLISLRQCNSIVLYILILVVIVFCNAYKFVIFRWYYWLFASSIPLLYCIQTCNDLYFCSIY